MTERKPSDSLIEEKFRELKQEIQESPIKSHEQIQIGLIDHIPLRLAKWARDFDPWFYTKDGELPEFNKEVQLKGIDGENDFGWLVWHPSGNHYWEVYNTHEIEEDREKDILDLLEVWCWQPIVNPLKQGKKH